jgi:hypothetical protein
LIAARVFEEVEQDEYYDPTLQVSIKWHDKQFLPTLLDWKAAPAVRLAWCRVHHGEFTQPRRSDEVVEVTPGSAPDLAYLGRVGDSLTFSVSGGKAPVGYNGTDAPGFRYDMATDAAVVLPLVADPPATPSPYPAGLPVYPYFAFVEPGDRLFPDSPFSPAVTIASLLRCHCRFEPALKWYQLVTNPLLVDNTWVVCEREGGRDPDVPPGNVAGVVVPGPGTLSLPAMCCDSTKISAGDAKHRAIVLLYLETLVEWSRALMRRYSPESAQQARLVLDTAARILGHCPRTVVNHELPNMMTVATFVPLVPPLNPRLLQLYCHVRDGLALVHRCLTAARLRDTTKACRPPYWGQDPCSCGPIDQYCGCESPQEPCCEDEWCRPHSPYRFTTVLQKARKLQRRYASSVPH